ncbi:MAG: YegS/Rv2252/BmrU family lipid kinase [Clostridiales bacterium]|nr:YegS/Rv2252/BmrU family lipid kinase [Clostridiales bacterium]
MKHIFIVNPAAGQRAGEKNFTDKIETAAKSTGADFEIYMTKCVGDATEYVRTRLEKRDSETLEGTLKEEYRFYACGGDGTHNEVVNGLIGFENTAFGVIPIGTGNDFIRNFGTAEQFLDICAQIMGTPISIDTITYRNEYKGEIKTGSVVNMVNLGFDANVVDLTAVLKTKPFISGSLAYILGVVILLVKKKGAKVRITSEGEVIKEGPILLSAFTNGCYCGGGWKGIPLAKTDDGLMDVSIVNDLKRREFVTLVPKYQKGTHLETKLGKRAVMYNKKKSVMIEAFDGIMRPCIDGEMIDSERMSLEINPLSARFIIPTSL